MKDMVIINVRLFLWSQEVLLSPLLQLEFFSFFLS